MPTTAGIVEAGAEWILPETRWAGIPQTPLSYGGNCCWTTPEPVSTISSPDGGARGAQQRAEPEDFLAALLAHPVWAGATRERLIRRLDRALLNWLKAGFDWSLSDIGTFGTRAYTAQMSDALTVAARLPLTDTAQDLIHDQATWDNRFRGLRWPGDIDLLRQFNLVLARHQTDARFVSRWFATCDDASWGSPPLADRSEHRSPGAAKAPGNGRYRAGEKGGCRAGAVRGAGARTRNGFCGGRDHDSAPGCRLNRAVSPP